MDRPKRIEINRGLSAEPHRHDPERGWYWRVVYWEAGQRKRFGLGWYQSRREAMAAAAGWVPPVPEEEPAPEEVPLRTLRDLLGAWAGAQQMRQEKGKIAPKTVELYLYDCRQIAGIVGDLPMAAIPGCRDFGEQLEEGLELAPTSLHRIQKTLAFALTWAVEEGLLAVAPKINFGEYIPEPHYTPTTTEILAVHRWISDHKSEWIGLAYLVQASTGARIREVATLNWGGVDFERGVLILNGKTGRREVPLPVEDPLWGRLRDWQCTNPLRLWPGVLGTTVEGINNAIRAATEALGQAHWTSHGLRRAAIERLMASGVDPGTASRITGHSVNVMLSIYHQPRLEERREAMASIALDTQTPRIGVYGKRVRR